VAGAFVAGLGGHAMAQVPTSTDDLNQETARLRAETERLKAEIERLQAQRQLESLAEPVDTRLAELQKAQQLAAAQEQLAKSETSKKIAEEIGDVKGGTYSGAITLKEKTGTVEALLLANKAVRVAAFNIAEVIAPKMTSAETVLIPARSFASFQRLISFRFRKGLIEQALRSSLPAEDVQGELPPAAGGAAAPALVSAGLDAFSKILGFFKTDYETAGLDVAIDETVAVYALAGALEEKGKIVTVPLTYMPAAQKDAVDELVAQMNALVELRAKVELARKQSTVRLTEIEKLLASEKDPSKKLQLANETAMLKDREVRWKSAAELYDSFATSLTTPEAPGGLIPLVALANDLAIDNQIRVKNAHVLLIRLETTGGGYLFKKNIITGLGGMPLFHMGGSALGYMLLNGANGSVLAAGSVVEHGGYVASDELPSSLKSRPPQPPKKR
jgi:hypothetical protein